MELLDDTEMARWTLWKRATDAVWDAIVHDVGAATGLSGADFAVLTRLVELGDGSLRQQELATSLGWQRSRLSRQISRMATRGLLIREADGAARVIAITKAGRDAVAEARPVHAAAIHRALFDSVPAAAAEQFWSTIATIVRIAAE
jgi:DNA-binding MarR family transcriptional regulator